VSGGILPLPQATGERAAVQAVLLAECLQAQAAPQVLLDEATYLGTTAALACCMDRFAAHASSSASNPPLVKDAGWPQAHGGFTLTVPSCRQR